MQEFGKDATAGQIGMGERSTESLVGGQSTGSLVSKKPSTVFDDLRLRIDEQTKRVFCLRGETMHKFDQLVGSDPETDVKADQEIAHGGSPLNECLLAITELSMAISALHVQVTRFSRLVED